MCIRLYLPVTGWLAFTLKQLMQGCPQVGLHTRNVCKDGGSVPHLADPQLGHQGSERVVSNLGLSCSSTNCSIAEKTLCQKMHQHCLHMCYRYALLAT